MSIDGLFGIPSEYDARSATKRRRHYADRLAVAEEVARLNEAAGACPLKTYDDPMYFYRKLLRAQIDFAAAQIRATESPERKSSQSREEQSGGPHDPPA